MAGSRWTWTSLPSPDRADALRSGLTNGLRPVWRFLLWHLVPATASGQPLECLPALSSSSSLARRSASRVSSSGVQYWRSTRLDQPVCHLGRRRRVEFSQPPAHLLVQNESLGYALIDPRLDGAGGGRPAKRVGDLGLDLARRPHGRASAPSNHFGLSAARAGFQRDLLLQACAPCPSRGSGRRCRRTLRRRGPA
jgi:hypothetical protein